MCGRYSNTVSLKKLADRFAFRPVPDDSPRRFNIAPGQDCPVVLNQEGQRVLRMFHWGLVPSWVKDLKASKHKMINARAETVGEKPSFRKCFQSKRCLILADGFYEWKQVEGEKRKQPFRITLKDQAPFAFAGLFDEWKRDNTPALQSFTIITTSANDNLNPIHDRMPVILKPGDEDLWLDTNVKDLAVLKNLLQPYSNDEIYFYPVSDVVNSPRNEIKECIVPVS